MYSTDRAACAAQAPLKTDPRQCRAPFSSLPLQLATRSLL
jgi:hypothetical protein